MAVAVIAVLVAANSLRLYELIVMAAVFGAADAFFGPASMSMVPELLPADHVVPLKISLPPLPVTAKQNCSDEQESAKTLPVPVPTVVQLVPFQV